MFDSTILVARSCAIGFIVLGLQACGDRTASQEVADIESASEPVVHNENAAGVQWRTDPDAAIEEASSDGRPVMLYFTAEWCPPCHDLKAYVFSQPSFIEKSKLFVPVYLDSDQPHSGSWAEEFGVVGYPTMVVVYPDGTEIVRVTGGMNLAAYEGVLDTALSVAQPMDELLAGLDGANELSLASCRRLAYHAWLNDSTYSGLGNEIGTKLYAASQQCPAEALVARARLSIVAAAMLAPGSESALSSGDEVDSMMWEVLHDVYRASQDPAQADPNALIILSAPKEFHSLANLFSEEENVDVVSPWLESLARFAKDPDNTRFIRLYAIGGRISLLRDSRGEDSVSEEEIAEARQFVTDFLNEAALGYGRSALLNPAIYTLTTLGDHDAAQALLLEEIPRSKTPYYQMRSLAYLLEDTGDHAQALDWFKKAYESSSGRATRLQWGSSYARACIRLSPDDAEQVVAASVNVIGEIEEAGLPVSAHRSIDRLENALSDWNADGVHDVALAEIRSAMIEACGSVEGESVERCNAFLAPES